MASPSTYTARPDAKRRVVLRSAGGALYDQYLVRHRDDGVIELRPQVSVDVASISKRTLGVIEQSMAALARGEVSAPVDLDETFPGLDLDAEDEAGA